ncbi:MAG: hypothetical protein AB7D37_18215 [Desulfovibrio sp.]
MSTSSDAINNRPEELYNLPFYKDLPVNPISIDWSCGSMDDLLKLDILTLDGAQPSEDEHFRANGGVLHTDITDESFEIYSKRKATFQLISVIVNAYAFKNMKGTTYAKPYNISLFPFSKRGEVQNFSIDFLKSISMSEINSHSSIYIGFNPFKRAYGVFSPGGLMADTGVESDMIGFVDNTYALATSFDHSSVTVPFIQHTKIANDFKKYRNRVYFKKFKTVKPRKIWGCDSPIELFLLQAMDHLGLSPMIQTMIGEDGYIASTYHTLWNDKKLRNRFKIITEADFYFPEKRLAIFCDSKEFHSSDKSKKKDQLIDEKLDSIGIKSLRIHGKDIAESPISCAKQVESSLG